MRRRPVRGKTCPNTNCHLYRQRGHGNIIRHGSFKTRLGKRFRYRCTACDSTFSSNTGTAYHRIQHSRKTFDTVATMSVEGVHKPAISRVLGLSWNTVDRWLERAVAPARTFNAKMIHSFELIELQADEIRAFMPRRSSPIWVFADIEVWSRLWPSTVVGTRSYANTRGLLEDTLRRSYFEHPPLITTDGFGYYVAVINRLFGPACVYGRVLKTWRSARVHSVDTHVVIGLPPELDAALSRSEDSSRLNTSFIERLNLTIRQGSAFLSRRNLAHARLTERLDDHLELLRCHYNFVRRHLALKFGREVRTPAMQAGLLQRRLTFRDIFTSTVVSEAHLVFAWVALPVMDSGDEQRRAA